MNLNVEQYDWGGCDGDGSEGSEVNSEIVKSFAEVIIDCTNDICESINKLADKIDRPQ